MNLIINPLFGYARLISFEINFITKETRRAEPDCYCSEEAHYGAFFLL